MSTRVCALRGATSPTHSACLDGEVTSPLSHWDWDVCERRDSRQASGSPFGQGREPGRVAGRRIALFTGNYHHVPDGVAKTLRRLVRYLEHIGHHVLVFGPSGVTAVNGRYVAVKSVPMPGRPEYRLTLALTRAGEKRLEDFSPDVLHIATPDPLGAAAMKWGRTRGIPIVGTYHTHFPAYLRYYHLQSLEAPVRRYLRWFYRRCQCVCVPTAPLQGFFASLGLTRNVLVWGRGVDTEAFNPRWRSDEWRTRFDIAPDDIVVSYVGRLVKEKGLDVFASVVDRLRSAGVSVRSLVVGDGPLRKALMKRLPETTFTGYLDRRDLSRAYSSSDVFLFPSDSEAFGNVIVEAMASGLPVVCADSSGSSLHVVDGQTGFVIPPGDVDRFFESTMRLVADRQERLRMGARARVLALKYNWEDVLLEMARIYEQVIVSDRVGTEMRADIHYVDAQTRT